MQLLAQSGNVSRNRYSLEGSVGLSSALTHLPDSLNPKAVTFFKPMLAGRYMFNPRWGVMTDASFEFFESNNLKTSMNYFRTVNLRLSFQVILNLGRTLHFERFAPNFSILMHGGGGFSSLRDARTNWIKGWRTNMADEKMNLLVGLTPQYRLNNRWVLTADLTYLTHWHQNYEFNFGPKILDPKSIQGSVLNAHLGVTYYIGKYKEHVDWQFEEKKSIDPPVETPLVENNEKTNHDMDYDGIPDSLDLCPDKAGLKTYGGCPAPVAVAECHLEEFPVLRFDKSTTVLTEEHKQILKEFAICLNKDASIKLIIHGYADNIGDPISIDDIAYRRALNVKRQLTQEGVDKDRLVAMSEGAKRPKLADSVYSRIGHNRLAVFERISNNRFDIKELTTDRSLQGLLFTIQVGAYSYQFNPNALQKFGKVLYSKAPNQNLTRYSVGIYQSKDQALKELSSLKRFGMFPDAFVTAYYLGERITIKRAESILRDMGDGILEKP